MEQKFDPSVLNKFLYQALVLTEKVKNVLKLNCDEALFSLKPWRVETMIKQENACICSRSETGVEEIAAGISRTLLQTQQLREKLSSGTITGKDSQKQLSISEIYNPVGTDGKKKGREKGHASNKKSFAVENSETNKLNVRKKSPGKDLQTKTTEESLSTHSEETKNKQLTVHSGKLTKNKNFLAINKQNIKNTKEIRKYKNTNHKGENNSNSSTSITKTKCIKFDKRSSMASTSELKDLIQKMSNESSDCASFNTDSTKCPIHGNVTSQFTYEQNFITIDVVDSLNIFSIPEGIIKPLKAYHAYLNNDISDKLVDNGKQRKMFNKFLTEFDKMDKAVQKSLAQKNHVTTALTKFMSLFQNLFSEDMKTVDLTSIKQVFAEINSAWHVYDTQELASLHSWKSDTQEILNNNFCTTEWMSNGVWNSYTRIFEGLSKVHCMYYANNKQLLLFFEMMQQLQQTQYSKDLIQITLDVLPNMKVHFDSTKSEYVKMYKVIHIISQGLNPKIPVLVRTDK